MDPRAESLQGPEDSLTPVGSPRRGSLLESEASEETSTTSSASDDRERGETTQTREGYVDLNVGS
jgi:hypothetical protein